MYLHLLAGRPASTIFFSDILYLAKLITRRT